MVDIAHPVVPADAVEAAYGELARSAPTDPEAVERRVEELLSALTVDERIGLLSGDGAFVRGTRDMAKRYNGEPIVAASSARVGLPGIRFTDGPRGVVMYASTAFPVPMARAATFDPELEERIGDAIGVEARTQGANLFAGVCINLLRHPAWGRAQETYGEDTFLLGEMGAALVRGTQRHVMACVKHFALNSMENSRLWLDVRVADADLRDLYLPHFRRCIDEGAVGVMTAYNRVNGTACGHHRHLITEILKGEWGFDGFTMSDFTFGVHGARAAVVGGQDLEMPYGAFFRRLPGLVRRGRVPMARIDDAARRLIRAQVRFATAGELDRYRPEVVAGPEHRALAREAAARSVVLLENRPVPRSTGEGSAPVLPIEVGAVGSIAVIGWLAAEENLGDLGSSQVHPPSVVTVLDGLRAAADERGIVVHHHDGRDVEAAARAAASADVAIVVAGSTWRDEGEWILKAGGDRRSLRLGGGDEALIGAVARANPRTAVVLLGGSAFVVDPWIGAVGAVAMAWYPGMEGGHGIADVLFGDAEPRGRLPCTWPRVATRLPPFKRFAWRIRYGPLFGYRLMEATRQTPAFWFGHGLGYQPVRWGEPVIEPVVESAAAAGGASGPGAGDRGGRRRVTLRVELRNDGGRPAHETVQVYVPEVLGTHPAPAGALRGFQHVEVAPGTSASVAVEVAVPASATVVRVGPSADPTRLIEVAIPPVA
jgi:beta-glucosidase